MIVGNHGSRTCQSSAEPLHAKARRTPSAAAAAITPIRGNVTHPTPRAFEDLLTTDAPSPAAILVIQPVWHAAFVRLAHLADPSRWCNHGNHVALPSSERARRPRDRCDLYDAGYPEVRRGLAPYSPGPRPIPICTRRP